MICNLETRLLIRSFYPGRRRSISCHRNLLMLWHPFRREVSHDQAIQHFDRLGRPSIGQYWGRYQAQIFPRIAWDSILSPHQSLHSGTNPTRQIRVSSVHQKKKSEEWVTSANPREAIYKLLIGFASKNYQYMLIINNNPINNPKTIQK